MGVEPKAAHSRAHGGVGNVLQQRTVDPFAFPEKKAKANRRTLPLLSNQQQSHLADGSVLNPQWRVHALYLYCARTK